MEALLCSMISLHFEEHTQSHMKMLTKAVERTHLGITTSPLFGIKDYDICYL